MINELWSILLDGFWFVLGFFVGTSTVAIIGLADYFASKYQMPARQEMEEAQAQVSGAKQRAKQITQGAEERFKHLDRCARELEPYVEQLARQRRRHERKVAELEALVVSLQQRRDALRGFKL